MWYNLDKTMKRQPQQQNEITVAMPMKRDCVGDVLPLGICNGYSIALGDLIRLAYQIKKEPKHA
jgi:hypothetical protein